MSTKGDVHEAIKGFLPEAAIATGWCLVVEVAETEGRYLAHRAGGGIDGTEPPTMWAVLGMLEASAGVVRDQLSDMGAEPPEEET